MEWWARNGGDVEVNNHLRCSSVRLARGLFIGFCGANRGKYFDLGVCTGRITQNFLCEDAGFNS